MKDNYLGDDLDTSEHNVPVAGDIRQQMLTDLTGSAVYTVSVAAVNDAGLGNRSDIISINTSAGGEAIYIVY